MIKMRAPADVTGASWNGRWYPVVNGCVEVPASAESALATTRHGFVRVQERAPTSGGRVAQFKRGR
jgi:hypothetical protein